MLTYADGTDLIGSANWDVTPAISAIKSESDEVNLAYKPRL